MQIIVQALVLAVLTDWGLGDWIPVKSVAAKEPQTLSAGKYAFSINM